MRLLGKPIYSMKCRCCDNDETEIEVIHTNINMFNIPLKPEKIKKTQDMSNIISAFDEALFKMKS